ncbi:MAG: hypothetical protein R3F59_06295 [Myxococcota bacterium]
MRLALALAVGCQPGPPPTEPDPTFADLAAAGGYVVGDGTLAPFDYAVCCEPGASCLHNNPSTPYQFVNLPPAPGQAAPEADVDADGRAWIFHLRPDEAIVEIGRTPAARYFSWRSYLVSQQAVVAGPFASLGPSLNNVVVAARRGDPADAPFAVVTTMDAAREREIAGWLVQSGLDPEAIYVDRIPRSLVSPGLDPLDDTFLVMVRAAVFEPPEAIDAWVADAGFTVYRLTPDAPEQEPAEPHPPQPLPPQGTGTDEAWLQPEVDALGDAIRAAYPDRFAVDGTSEAAVFGTYDCIEGGHCAFEIRDRYYAALLPIEIPEGTFAVAYGVNHARSGKATYANVAVNAETNHLGLDVVEDDAMVGSARTYLPDAPHVDDLYAVVVARNCDPFPDQPCMLLAPGCPGLPPGTPAKIDFRAYLEPTTGSGPLATELLPDRGLFFGQPQ